MNTPAADTDKKAFDDHWSAMNDWFKRGFVNMIEPEREAYREEIKALHEIHAKMINELIRRNNFEISQVKGQLTGLAREVLKGGDVAHFNSRFNELCKDISTTYEDRLIELEGDDVDAPTKSIFQVQIKPAAVTKSLDDGDDQDSVVVTKSMESEPVKRSWLSRMLNRKD